VQGNERVVRPRLADAKFFFDQDRKKTLASRVEGLSKVVYHNKLGTQGERVARVRAIAAGIACLDLAKALGFVYVDTGAMYRACALAARRAGIPWNEGAMLGRMCAELPMEFRRGEGGDLRLHLGGEGYQAASGKALEPGEQRIVIEGESGSGKSASAAVTAVIDYSRQELQPLS